MRLSFLLSCLIPLCIFVHNARASDPLDLDSVPDGPEVEWDAEHQASFLSVYLENDIFTGSDREYTNGCQLTFTTRDVRTYDVWDWLQPVVDRLPFINDPKRHDAVRNLSTSIGQFMFTPDDLTREDVIKDQRPYAGYLFGSLGFHSKTDRILDVIELQMGIIGDWSFAEDSQKLVHKWKGAVHPEGWDNQLNNELGLMAIFERKYRWSIFSTDGGMDMDLIPAVGVVLGNVYTYGSVGAQLRVGYNVPQNFGTTTIRAAGSVPGAVDTDFGIHVFAGADGRAMLRNIFLDGNTFEDSHSVDRETWVGDLSVGGAVHWRSVTLTYSLVYRSREYESQKQRQSFGSVSLTLPL